MLSALSDNWRETYHDIDELSPNQPVHLRFSAFNFRTTPELNGKVNWIGADQIEDKQTGTAHYLVRIGVPTSELARLKGLRIIPGMPVEAFIQTESQTALTYLLKPLTDQVMRAFRES